MTFTEKLALVEEALNALKNGAKLKDVLPKAQPACHVMLSFKSKEVAMQQLSETITNLKAVIEQDANARKRGQMVAADGTLVDLPVVEETPVVEEAAAPEMGRRRRAVENENKSLRQRIAKMESENIELRGQIAGMEGALATAREHNTKLAQEAPKPANGGLLATYAGLRRLIERYSAKPGYEAMRDKARADLNKLVEDNRDFFNAMTDKMAEQYADLAPTKEQVEEAKEVRKAKAKERKEALGQKLIDDLPKKLDALSAAESLRVCQTMMQVISQRLTAMAAPEETPFQVNGVMEQAA